MENKESKNFGVVLGIAFAVFSLVLFVKHNRYFVFPASISLILIMAAVIKPALLIPVKFTWMKFSLLLSWINTRVLLIILYYLVITPINILMKIFRYDPLEKIIDKEKKSYWKDKENNEFNKENYLRQF